MLPALSRIISLSAVLALNATTAEVPRTEAKRRSEIIVGVQATWSREDCQERWQPTAGYLSEAIPEARFVIRPLAYEEVLPCVERGKIDFLVANPAFYATCERLYHTTRIATRVGSLHGQPAKTYAGVIICNTARTDLQSLESLRGRTLMAVHPWSFGGWLMAHRELHKLGMRVDRDLLSVRFAGQHDSIVKAVAEGRVDAGTVCADDLERMIQAGRIQRADVRVLRARSQGKAEETGAYSTRAYPQWAFAKLEHTSDELAERVTERLLQMPANSPAARSADTAGWTIPLTYEPVHECLRELRVGPYEHLEEVTLTAAVRAYWPWLAAACFLMIIGWSVTGTILWLNRRLRESEALRREAEAFAASGRLAASVAHEINNPMGGIVNCLHLVRGTLAADHPASRYLAAAEKETARVTRIVRQMLTLHRCRPEKASTFRLEPAVEDVVLMLHPLARDRSVRVESRVVDREESVRLPEESLRQILLNLLANAIEASSAGDAVHLEVARSRRHLEVRVSDNGEGISAEMLDRVFEPFFSTKSGSERGLGLGLSICRGIVESLEGTLSLESCVGRGTTFRVRLPLQQEARRSGLGQGDVRVLHPSAPSTTVQPATRPAKRRRSAGATIPGEDLG
ncbi:MAG: sensor histidine kinase [Pirellulales bacterium]|nr:sensor histidine kinase [Pirellulales bacterium]